MAISFQPAQDALRNLSDALSILQPTELERDGTVRRFEYCYEIVWKLVQRVLKDHGIVAEYPKFVFRELGRLGWIQNVEDWIEFQKARNDTSHEYGVKYAIANYTLAQSFLPLATNLFSVLKSKNHE
ncbi:MAG: nucleotidyltransferase substrate binding protein [Bdellovibrionaceae bacterium]|nr:nucleotidyltransferase substrate binding protein [Pseudobdellovibrionaceae bacterium]